MMNARGLLAMVMVLGAADLVQAQPYPNKPIKLVVGFPAGGATDTTARLIAQRMQ
jgi:tripartite-type tricarboxylate transporter receptor subunit TctC